MRTDIYYWYKSIQKKHKQIQLIVIELCKKYPVIQTNKKISIKLWVSVHINFNCQQNDIFIKNLDDNFILPLCFVFIWNLGGIPYTAHGVQITPPPCFLFVLFFCFYTYSRLGKG